MNPHHLAAPRGADAPDRRRAVRALLAVPALLAAGCTGSLLPAPAPAPTRFTLDGGAPSTVPAAAPAQALVITLEPTRAAPGYDGRAMLYQRQPPALEAFAFHEWVAPPAQMLTPLLVRAVQAGGAFAVVLAAPTAAAGGWQLETQLLRLHQDFTATPSQLRLGLRAVLLDSATRQALAARDFEFSVPTSSDNPVAGARAAQQAAQQLATAVAAFCAAQVQAVPRPPAPARPLSGAGPAGRG